MKKIAIYALICFCIQSHASENEKNNFVKSFHILLQQQTDTDLQDFSIIPEEHYITRTINKSDYADTLFLVYMAADNNLHYFAWNNIKQMANVGSNKNVKIVIQLNEPGAHKKTQRYLIEKNKAVLLNQEQVAAGKKFNTGDPQTLIEFCNESIKRFPSKHIVLVLWDHGTGYLDPLKAKTSNLYELFELNPTDMMLELNRKQEFMERFDVQGDCRGLCFDETYHSYLSNQKLDYALNSICKTIKRKIDIIGTDACMMQMVEFGALIAPYANFHVGSEEVELGAGWNYKHILRPFEEHAFTPRELSRHIVNCYQKTYARITHDYALSALDLIQHKKLIDNVHEVGTILVNCLKKQKNKSVENAIIQARSRKNCTCFDEPSYIDLGHFYANLKEKMKSAQLYNNPQLISNLNRKLSEGIQIIKDVIFANATGKNIKNAQGISIYLPEKRMHPSYAKTPFAQTNNWGQLVNEFIHREISIECATA